MERQSLPQQQLGDQHLPWPWEPGEAVGSTGVPLCTAPPNCSSHTRTLHTLGWSWVDSALR